MSPDCARSHDIAIGLVGELAAERNSDATFREIKSSHLAAIDESNTLQGVC
jgi:hypothetical protein